MVTVRAVPAGVTLPLRQQVLRPHQTVDELREPDDDTPDSASFAAFDETTGDVVATGVVRRRPPPWAETGAADSDRDGERSGSRGRGHDRAGDGDDDGGDSGDGGRDRDRDGDDGDDGRDRDRDRDGDDDGGRDRDGWQVRAMAVAPGQRGRGVGRAVLDALLAHVDAAGGGTVWCNARVPAQAFYERAGFTVVGEPFDLPAIGPHVVMALRRPDRSPGPGPG